MVVVLFIICFFVNYGKQNVVQNSLVINFASGPCNIKLLFPGRNKIAVLTEIRAIFGYNLKEAKDIIDNTPSLVYQKIDEESALLVKQKLEILGAIVEIEKFEVK